MFANQFDTTNIKEAVFYFWASGRGHYWLGDYPKSYSMLEKASYIASMNPSSDLQGEIYLDLAASLSIADQTGKALSFLLDAKEILNKHGNSEQKARCGIALGELFRKISEFDKAFHVLYETLPSAKKQTNTLAMYYNRLAAVHTEAGDIDSSIHYSTLALTLAKELNEPSLIAISENELGYILLTQGRFDEALPYFYRAYLLWKTAGLLRYAIHAMHHISVCYGSTDRLKESLEITHEAYSLLRNKQWYQIEVKLLEDLRNLQFQLGRQDSGEYYERKRLEGVILWKDQQYALNTKMVEAQYSLKQKEELIERQQLELNNQIQREETIRKDRIYLSLISISLFFLATALAYIAFLQKKKRKQSMRKQEVIVAQKTELQKALTENQALLQELHHRIKNNLQQISTLLDMQRRIVKDEGGRSALLDAQQRISAMGTVHEMLYSYDNLASISISNFLSSLINSIKVFHEQRDLAPVEFQINLGNDSLRTPDAISLGMIVSEAVSNSIKHRQLDGKTQVIIGMQSIKNDSFLQITIADNNSGRTEVLKTKKDERLGIRLMEIFAQKLNGTLNFVQGQNGLIVEISFPKT